MAYADFTLSGITKQFGLIREENADLYGHIPAIAPDPAFLNRLQRNAAMALKISTEKARSEFIIAPILAEVRFLASDHIALFSGVDFNVDPQQNLVGFCDYIVTRSPEQYFIEAPVLMLVEAKNEDMKRGYAQCLAEMIAAQTFNAREGSETEKMYGAVTIGNQWKFLELEGRTARIDAADYYFQDVGKIMGVLLYLATADTLPGNPSQEPSDSRA